MTETKKQEQTFAQRVQSLRHRMCRSSDTQQGFTFIELIVALAILGLLAAIAIPSYFAILGTARARKADAEINNIKIAIMSYNSDVGAFPRTLADLVKRPTDERVSKKWRGPYMEEEIADDPWQNPYVYRVTSGQKHPFELYSLGSKGTEGVKEDRIGIYN